MAYKEPTAFKELDGTVLTNYGQEVELQEREIDDKPNPLFVKYRNASSRIWLKNGKTLRILAEVDGVVDKDNPLAVGVAQCGPLEWQSFYNRLRVEKPIAIVPTEETL